MLRVLLGLANHTNPPQVYEYYVKHPAISILSKYMLIKYQETKYDYREVGELVDILYKMLMLGEKWGNERNELKTMFNQTELPRIVRQICSHKSEHVQEIVSRIIISFVDPESAMIQSW